MFRVFGLLFSMRNNQGLYASNTKDSADTVGIGVLEAPRMDLYVY